jgi:hypothetical protein
LLSAAKPPEAGWLLEEGSHVLYRYDPRGLPRLLWVKSDAHTGQVSMSIKEAGARVSMVDVEVVHELVFERFAELANVLMDAPRSLESNYFARWGIFCGQDHSRIRI